MEKNLKKYIYINMNYFAVHMKLTLHCKSAVKSRVAQSSPTLCNSVDCTVCGILQARTLEWVVLLFSRGSSQPRDWTQVSHIAGGFFTSWATREASILQLFLFFFFFKAQSCDFFGVPHWLLRQSLCSCYFSSWMCFLWTASWLVPPPGFQLKS